MYLLEYESREFIDTFETVEELKNLLNDYVLESFDIPLSNITIKKQYEMNEYRYSDFYYYKKNVALYPETKHFIVMDDYYIKLYEQIEDKGWISSEFTIKLLKKFYIKYPYEFLKVGNIGKHVPKDKRHKLRHIETKNILEHCPYENLEALCFWDDKNPKINKNDLPRVKTLELIRYNRDLAPGIIPYSVENLTMTIFNRPIKKGDLPESLKVLCLGFYFEQIITEDTLPTSLRILYLPTDYIHKDKLDHIPETVTIQFCSTSISVKKGRMNYKLYYLLKNKNVYYDKKEQKIPTTGITNIADITDITDIRKRKAVKNK